MALREIFARFGIDFDRQGNLRRGAREVDRTKRSVQRLTPLVNRLRSGFGSLGLAIGGVAAIHQMRSFVSETIRIGDNFDKTAQQVGLTTRELQAFSHAAELGGVDSAAFANGMGQLQRKAYDASTGLKEAQDAFEALGISVTDSSGQLKSGSQLLNEVADGLQNTENSTTRTALSMELMGRSGRRLLPMLTGGSEGLASMTAELEELGGGASEQMIRQSVELTDTLTRFRVRLLSIRSALAVRFLPMIERAVLWMGTFSEKITELVGNARLLKAGAIAVGSVLVAVGLMTIATWGPVVATVAAVATAIAALTLLIEDLWLTAADPEADTLTRRFLEWATGAENARQIIANLNQGIEDLRNTLATVGGFLGFEIGEEGTERRQASERGRTAREDITGNETFQAFARTLGQGQLLEAPSLTPESQLELDRMTRAPLAHEEMESLGRERNQAELARRRQREGEEYFERSFPDLARADVRLQRREAVQEQRVYGRASIPQSVPATQGPQQSINVDAPLSIEMTINEQQDAAETARMVDRRIRDSEARRVRQLEAGLLANPSQRGY